VRLARLGFRDESGTGDSNTISRMHHDSQQVVWVAGWVGGRGTVIRGTQGPDSASMFAVVCCCWPFRGRRHARRQVLRFKPPGQPSKQTIRSWPYFCCTSIGIKFFCRSVHETLPISTGKGSIISI